ncbi:MAG: Hpt domain-containing protein [Candidatus Zapsychrus exili]|nr:Hpt domain-containing protein [Candidatus Zapsychrus exili]
MSEQLFNLSEFMERVQDDKELLLELIEIYIEDFKIKRQSLIVAIEGNNSEEIRNIAHSLKGASGNISAHSLREVFSKLEGMGKNEDLTGAPELIADADKIFEEFLSRVSNLKEELG